MERYNRLNSWCVLALRRLGLLPEDTEAEVEDRTSTVKRPPRR